jgi:hypothetical protein
MAREKSIREKWVWPFIIGSDYNLCNKCFKLWFSGIKEIEFSKYIIVL